MYVGNSKEAIGRLKSFLHPWHDAVADPKHAQQKVVGFILESYVQTDYGKEHGASKIVTVGDFRRAFSITTYEEYWPLIHRVMAGEVKLLFSERPIGWAITRGTTKGESKFVPMTPTDLHMGVSVGRPDMFIRCSLFPLYWPRLLVDSLAVCLGRDHELQSRPGLVLFIWITWRVSCYLYWVCIKV